jgi:myosin heavy subunit
VAIIIIMVLTWPLYIGSGTPTGGAKKLKTLAGQFRSQLLSLYETLKACSPHFVRCVKSNPEKLPNYFSSPRVLEQLRYSGLLEVSTRRHNHHPL